MRRAHDNTVARERKELVCQWHLGEKKRVRIRPGSSQGEACSVTRLAGRSGITTNVPLAEPVGGMIRLASIGKRKEK